MKERNNIFIIGHLTKDVIKIDDKIQQQTVGGVPYYTGIALANLGVNIGIITKVAPKDQALLDIFEPYPNIKLFHQNSTHTSTFENSYYTTQPDKREQLVTAIASPFTKADIQQLSFDNTNYLHLGPLTPHDFEVSFFQTLAQQSQALLSLDIQGLLRNVSTSKVILQDYAFKDAVLPYIHTLKADVQEAQLITNTQTPQQAAQRFIEHGIKEVLITTGSKGSFLSTEEQEHHIPAYPVSKIVDTTGCGDTYLAAYLASRLKGEQPQKAAHFAAQIAAQKLTYFGAYRFKR